MTSPSIYRTAALALAIAPATAAQPQPGASPADTATVRLAPVVVTATRTAKELADVAAPVTVVSEAQIRQQGATRLADVLEALPGLQIVEDHGAGRQVQGVSSEYTLILLDLRDYPDDLRERCLQRSEGYLKACMTVAMWNNNMAAYRQLVKPA